MATGEKNPAVSVDQEECFDWPCGVCEEKGLVKEAKSYCKNCGEGLCESCLPFHNKYNKTHSVLGTEEKAGWGKAEIGSGSLPECSEHEGQSISMYCGRHDDLCCPVCAVLKHDNSCKPSMSYIPQVAKGIRNSQGFQDTVNSLEDLIVRFTKLEQEKSEFQEYLKAKQDESVECIEQFYTDITKRIEALRKGSLAEYRKLHEDIDTSIQDDIEKCRKATKQLQDMKERMFDTSQMNESLLFITMKNNLKRLPAVKEISSSIHAKPKTTPRFEPNSSLTDAVHSATGIGKILTESSKTSGKLDVETEPSLTTIPSYGPELARMMYVGARVMRGRDWGYGNLVQPGGEGTVIHVRKGWVSVKWDNGLQCKFRMGHRDAYELTLVPGTYKHPSKR